jgi:hypothetical protein
VNHKARTRHNDRSAIFKSRRNPTASSSDRAPDNVR